MAKKITDSQIKGEHGVAMIHVALSEMGHVWHPTGGTEAGTDGYIELRRPDGTLLGTTIPAQSKAEPSRWTYVTAKSFTYTCRREDLDYWLKGNTPFLVICSNPATNEIYFKEVTSYFADRSRRRKRQIVFDKVADRFDASARDRLLDLARTTGEYIEPPRETTRLVSNLLEIIQLPDPIFVAPAQCPNTAAVVRELQGRWEGGREYLVHGNSLITVHDPRDDPAWARVCDTGAVDEFGADEWAESDDPVLLGQWADLLQRCLISKVYEQYTYWRDENLFYHRPSADLSDVLVGKSKRAVFRRYDKKDGSLLHYRHVAFQASFQRFAGTWFAQLVPTYLFTHDGKRKARWHSDSLKGIKRLEKNSAVRQQVQGLARYLSAPENLLEPEYPHLKFGSLFDATGELTPPPTRIRADRDVAEEEAMSL